jgi:hypothetical protein
MNDFEIAQLKARVRQLEERVDGLEYAIRNVSIHGPSSTFNFPLGSPAQRAQWDAERARGCFPGDAKILTPSGLARLDSLKAGDMVVSWQKSTRTWVNCPVKKVVPYGQAPIMQIDLSVKVWT